MGQPNLTATNYCLLYGDPDMYGDADGTYVFMFCQTNEWRWERNIGIEGWTNRISFYSTISTGIFKAILRIYAPTHEHYFTPVFSNIVVSCDSGFLCGSNHLQGPVYSGATCDVAFVACP